MIVRRVFFAGTVTALILILTVVSFLLRNINHTGYNFGKALGNITQGSNGTANAKLLKREDIPQKRTFSKIQGKKGQEFKVVLLYTPLFGRLPWTGLETSYNLTHFHGKPCANTNCRLTYNKRDLAISDAVFFHGRDIPSVNTMKEISRNRNLKQRWVYLMHENPYNTFYDPAIYNNFFNWTMTYRRDSDYFMPYNYYSLILDSMEKRGFEELKNHAQGKDKFIAWMVSNCGHLRDKITLKLLQYVNVTVFGSCAKHFNQSNHCERTSSECGNLLKRFKFYLSFENANCVDYVTEKYWHTPFLYDMVPIVSGPSNYSKIAIPGSYINVMDFPSLEDLASYLKYLDRNDTSYNMYFKWKSKYKLDYPNPTTCQICADLHNTSLPVKVYDDLGTFWGQKSSCGEDERKIRKLLQT